MDAKTMTMPNGDIVNLKDQAVRNMMSDEFNTSSTYDVGDVCIYNNALYKCITAITTAGAWDSTKWSQITLGEYTTELKSSLDDYKTHSIVEQVAYDSTSSATWYEATITPNAITGYTVCGVAGYKCNKSDVYPFAFYFNGSTLRIGIRRINGDLSDVKFTVYFEYYKS